MKVKLNDVYLKNSYFAVFFLSGFSGLIYESIWTHYLKLFLGHAAYAQALVLFIFMGGMAVGAWKAARYGQKIRNLLVVYACVEGIVGLFSIAFHSIFVSATDFVFLSVLGSVNVMWATDLLRWTLAALLVLPQSILLGMTFPLMSGGIIRKFPDNPGRTLSILYFTNTLGAAIGILVSGFVLIESVGLPGTLFVAGVINISLALIVWLLSHEDSKKAVTVEGNPSIPMVKSQVSNVFKILLISSAVTGIASFMYEIGWIRMLSHVLGSSTHAFELMLSSFILGLAIGGFWIRRRVDRFNNPISALGWIQLIMGVMALATLPVYGQSFEFMVYLFKSIARTDQGYILYNIASHGIALAVMLPATVCAGMTLPLITYILFSGGYGEPAIGKVYSVNTLGGLIGIALSVLVIMPVMGMKSLLVGGAILDIMLGLYLMFYVAATGKQNLWRGSVAIACCVLLLVTFFFHIKPSDINSSVFRGRGISDNSKIKYYKDGKTATIIAAQTGDILSISTNGKPDASISETNNATIDELTMIAVAAIPMAIHPDAKVIANIGIGSGLTSHTVLANPHIERLDTIEIEEAMVKGAKVFGNRVDRTFTDPRSRINIDDAKSFFSRQNRTYDMILSEPSNPWVSGVAGLFTREFYHLVKRHLASNGLYVQWLHLYEIDLELISSVIKAVSSEFDDYVLYMLDSTDIAIIAIKEGRVPLPSDSIFKFPALKDDLSRIEIRSLSDITARYLGSKMTLDSLFNTYPIPANSDYYPELDQGAVRALFTNKDAYELLKIRLAPLPILEVLEGRNMAVSEMPEGIHEAFELSLYYQKAQIIINYFSNPEMGKQFLYEKAMYPDIMHNLRLLSTIEHQCDAKGITVSWLPSLHWLGKSVLPYVQANEIQPFWKYLESSECYAYIPKTVSDWIKLYRAVDERDYHEMIRLSDTLLVSVKNMTLENFNYLVSASLLGNIAIDDRKNGLSVMNKRKQQILIDPVMRLLGAHLVTADNNYLSKLEYQ